MKGYENLYNIGKKNEMPKKDVILEPQPKAENPGSENVTFPLTKEIIKYYSQLCAKHITKYCTINKDQYIELWMDSMNLTDLSMAKIGKSTRLNSSHVSESRMPSSA